MVATHCPICGKGSLVERNGEYSVKVSGDVPGEVLVVPNAFWHSCSHCGEDLLPRALTKALEVEQKRCLSATTPVNC